MRTVMACLFTFVALSALVAVNSGGASGESQSAQAGTATVNGSVRTASGESSIATPIVVVDLFAAQGDGSRGEFLGSARVPEIGNYEFLVDRGCYVVVVQAPHGETFINGSRWFELPGCLDHGGTVGLPEVVIDDRDSIGADDVAIGDEVLDRDGRPVAGVVLNLFAAAGDGSRGAFLGRTETDAGGRYRFVAGSGCYVVVFIAPGGESFVNNSPYFERQVCLRSGRETDTIDAVLNVGSGSMPTTSAVPAPTTTGPSTTAQPTTTTTRPTTTTTRPTTTTTRPTTTTTRPTTTSTMPPTTAPPVEPASSSAAFGFSPGGWFADEPDSELHADLDRMVQAGATWFRIDFDWSEIERNRGTYHWHRTDRVIDAARARGLQVIGLITESPGWARSAGTTSYSPPNAPADYARFAAAVVERYGPRGVTTYELWNEPNLGMFWGPHPNPETYARLVKTAGQAMRAVRGDLTILSGGLAPAADEPDGSGISPTTFTRRMIEAGAADVFDGFAIHPFSYPARPIDASSAEWNPFHNLPEYHNLLAGYGHGHKPVWLTEYGAPTGTSSRAVSEAEQSAQITEALAIAADWSWTGPILLYAHRDSRWAPGDFQSNFGLIRHDGTPKQAWHDLLALRR